MLRSAVAFGVAYALAKGTSFVGAIALPRLVDAHTYGVLELALTVGAIVTSVLGFAAPGAAARMHLVEQDTRARRMLAGYCLWLATVSLLATVTLRVSGWDEVYGLCAAIIGVYGVQFALSSYTRMHGLNRLSGWFDNLALLLTALIAVVLVAAGLERLEVFAGIFVALSMMAVVASAVELKGASVGELRTLLAKALAVGGPMMLYSLSNVAIFNTPRVVLAEAGSIANVASFSVCSRLALVLILVHQLLSTGFFKQLYQMDKAMVGRVLAVWIVTLSGIAVIITVIARYTAGWLVIGTAVPAAAVVAIFPIVVVQTVFWILSANLEIFVNRELLSQRAAMIMVVLISMACCVGWLLQSAGQLGLMTILKVYTGLMIAAVLTQVALLSREGFAFGRCYAVLPIAAAPLIAFWLPAP